MATVSPPQAQRIELFRSSEHVHMDMDPTLDLSAALDALLAERWPIDGNPESVSKPLDDVDRTVSTVDRPAYRLACSLLLVLRNRKTVDRDFVDQAMLALCSHLSDRYQDVQASRSDDRVALSPWQERRAKEMMENHVAQGLSIAQIANSCSLSRSHFSRAFKKNTGVSPRDWFLQIRLDKAKCLLSDSSLSISQISLDCGFADQSHFTRVFTRMMRVTPFNWRRSQAVECCAD